VKNISGNEKTHDNLNSYNTLLVLFLNPATKQINTTFITGVNIYSKDAVLCFKQFLNLSKYFTLEKRQITKMGINIILRI